MARFFSPTEMDPGILAARTVAVLGYGKQGRAHALNLRDSGVRVVVGARAGKGADTARSDGFEPVAIGEAASEGDVLMLSLPDVPMRKIYDAEIAPGLRPGQALLFAHGFNVHYGLIVAPSDVDVALVSPKGAGAKVRSEFLEGRGIAALVAVHQDASGAALPVALSYAGSLGGSRGLVMETTFAEETETDLLGEQAVLCGGIPELLKAAFDTLVEAGHQPEAAYFECIHEAKLITDLIYARGLAGMRGAISGTAAWGGLVAGPRVVGPESRAAMRELMRRIRSGEFAKEWMAEDSSGQPRLAELREEEASHSSEEVGRDLRQRLGLEG